MCPSAGMALPDPAVLMFAKCCLQRQTLTSGCLCSTSGGWACKQFALTSLWLLLTAFVNFQPSSWSHRNTWGGLERSRALPDLLPSSEAPWLPQEHRHVLGCLMCGEEGTSGSWLGEQHNGQQSRRRNGPGDGQPGCRGWAHATAPWHQGHSRKCTHMQQHPESPQITPKVS